MKEHKALLTRVSKQDKQTLGQMDIINFHGDIVFTCFTLELPDLNSDGIEGNETRKSCIPLGKYQVKRHRSPKFGQTFWVQDVPGRSAILIHPGNFFSHTLGCILVATDQKDLNKDGYLDNVSSKAAMEKLLTFDVTELEIIET